MIKQCRRHAALSIPFLAIIAFNAIGSGAEPPAPIVPGYVQLQRAPKADNVLAGQLLLGELNCTSCHRADAPSAIDRKGAPDLSNAGQRITPQYLRAYLADPHGIKPGTTMPDVMHGLENPAKADQVEALTHYLVSLGGPIKPRGDEATSADIERGKSLFQSVGCLACHAPENAANTKIPSVPLPNLAMKTTISALAEFLANPLKVRPASRMPNLNLSEADANAIAAYLLREQFDNPDNASAPAPRSPGLRYEYFAAQPANVEPQTLDQMKVASKGRAKVFTLEIPHHTQHDWAVKFTGMLNVPADGKYTFYLTSDDGSRLLVDNKELIDNDGVHPATEKSASVELTAGDHPILLTYFQGGGEMELKVQWEGPAIAKQDIPPTALFYLNGRSLLPLKSAKFVVDLQKAKAGRAVFQTAGCAACHTIGKNTAGDFAKPLLALDPTAAGGCLSSNPSTKAPKYDLAPDQIAAMRAALADKDRLTHKLDPPEQITHALAAMNCYACHNRDGVGGPAADRLDYFVMSSPVDMGDEGKLPPRLTHVGAKLQKTAIEQIVFAGKLHVRPVLATRMPRFSQERLGELPDLLAQVDGPGDDPALPRLSEKIASDGRRLVGNKGLGCVNCHGVADVKSLGMPAPNLSTAASRLRVGWFHKLLENPSAVNPGTRMPAFWDHGQVVFHDLADGTMDGQINAIWTYLQAGENMPLPAGLLPSGGYELVPADQPIVHRTFVAPGLFSSKIGTRAILVGNPETVHFGFDADAVRLAIAWRGRFFDAAGQWDGRGGRALSPLGGDLLKMPEGPSFATLAAPGDPWPKIASDQRNVGGQFKGYTLDKQERPTFHYILDGVDIQEQPLPDLQTTANLLRKFHLAAKSPTPGLTLLAASGQKIEEKSPGVYTVDEKLSVRVDGPGVKAVIRNDAGTQELIVPVAFQNGEASINVEMSW